MASLEIRGGYIFPKGFCSWNPQLSCLCSDELEKGPFSHRQLSCWMPAIEPSLSYKEISFKMILPQTINPKLKEVTHEILHPATSILLWYRFACKNYVQLHPGSGRRYGAAQKHQYQTGPISLKGLRVRPTHFIKRYFSLFSSEVYRAFCPFPLSSLS